MNAYLDIETSFDRRITVVGIFKKDLFKQFVGLEITRENIEDFLRDVSSVYTYNGSRFDLPVIKKELNFDITEACQCKDLMYDCWRNELRGGLKIVESKLGISRSLDGVNGLGAMKLWDRFRKFNDNNALSNLLYYNKEDVLSLVKLHNKLERFCNA